MAYPSGKSTAWSTRSSSRATGSWRWCPGTSAREFELVALELRETLYREEEPIEAVYFPIDGVLSLVSQMQDGRGIEVATIGNEGMAGLPVFLQATLTSAHMAFAQIPGRALRMPAAQFSDFLTGPTTVGCTSL